MDMYQKRKMRAENKKNENKEENSKSNINWARRNLAKPTSNLHKISIFTIRLFAYCEKRR